MGSRMDGWRGCGWSSGIVGFSLDKVLLLEESEDELVSRT